MLPVLPLVFAHMKVKRQVNVLQFEIKDHHRTITDSQLKTSSTFQTLCGRGFTELQVGEYVW